MARTALLVAAAVLLLAAVALALVPFEARLATEARDGSPLSHTVGIACRAPVLDGLGVAGPGDGGTPRPCLDRARLRLGASAVGAVTGAVVLATGLRRPLRPARHPSRR